jgi:hypothetical protein
VVASCASNLMSLEVRSPRVARAISGTHRR